MKEGKFVLRLVEKTESAARNVTVDNFVPDLVLVNELLENY